MVRSVIEGGLTKAAAAGQFNTTAKTAAKWVERFRAEGVDGLRDRSSRPHSLPSQTAPATCGRLAAANVELRSLSRPQTRGLIVHADRRQLGDFPTLFLACE